MSSHRLTFTNKISYSNNAVVVKATKENYRGLFAKNFIKEGDLIERSPVIEFCSETSSHFKKTSCGEKFFAWRIDNDGDIISFAVGCGLLMMCNHSNHPNAIVKKDYNIGVIELYSIKNIRSDEEIFVKYFLTKTF